MCWQDIGNQALARLIAALEVSSGEVGIDYAFWHTLYAWEVRWPGCHCRMRSLLWAFPHGTTIYPQNLSDMTCLLFRQSLSITIDGQPWRLPSSGKSYKHCLELFEVQLKASCIRPVRWHFSIASSISRALSCSSTSRTATPCTAAFFHLPN